MNTLTIHTATGSVSVNLKSNSEMVKRLLEEDVVKVFFESSNPVSLGIGDHCVVFGRKYFINTSPIEKKYSSKLFEYEVTFESLIYDLSKVALLDVDATGIHFSHEFYLIGNVDTFRILIETNLERVFGVDKWTVSNLGVPTDKVVNLSFSENNCLQALQTLCAEFDCEYELSEFDNETTITLRKQAGGFQAVTFEYGKGKGLYDLKRTIASSNNLTTRLYAFGASRNLGANYRNYSTRLKLPAATSEDSHLDNPGAVSKYGVIERVVMFDDIFPQREGTVTAIGSTIYQFVDEDCFDLNAVDGDGNSLYWLGIDPKVSFRTGNLAGYEFTIAAFDTVSGTFTLQKYIDERSTEFPNPDTTAFQINVGDKYVILDIALPQLYIDQAESRLLIRAQEWLEKYSNDHVLYELNLDEKFISDQQISFSVGDGIGVVDADMCISEQIRITDVRRNLVRENLYTLILSNSVYKPKERKPTQQVRTELAQLKQAAFSQSDWTEENSLEPSYIKNKPDLTEFADKHLSFNVNYKKTETIQHDLGKKPSVSVLDEEGNLCIADVEYLDENSVTVNFINYFTGKIVFN